MMNRAVTLSTDTGCIICPCLCLTRYMQPGRLDQRSSACHWEKNREVNGFSPSGGRIWMTPLSPFFFFKDNEQWDNWLLI